MLNNKYKNNLNFAYSLAENFNNSNNSICIVVSDNKEAFYIKNELNLIIDDLKIKIFPENEIIPYDHFSVPKNINKQRFKIINNQPNYKHILITTIKNLFDPYPSIENFQSMNKYELGSRLPLDELINIIETLNYIKKTNVENINEYSVRGGIIDIFTPIYQHPLRIEIFDDYIESIRLFNKDTQLSIESIREFSISKGDIISLNESTINRFIKEWRNYFNDYDERNCSIFQNIKNNQISEGIEIYFPFFFKNIVSFFEVFDNYDYVRFKNLSSEVQDYETFITERFEDEINEINRPLIRPKDFYLDAIKIINRLNRAKLLEAEKFTCLYDSADSLIENYDKALEDNYNYLLVTSSHSDLQDLKNTMSSDITVIKDINDGIKKLNITVGPIVRNMYLKNINTFVVHRDSFDKASQLLNDKTKESRYVELNQLFNNGDHIIHEDYGLGIYSGLEIVEANNKKNEYIKIIYDKNENLYVPINNINKISIYHKNDNLIPLQLDSLSSKKWLIKKEKATKKAIDHAAEILDVESRRMNSYAHALKIENNDLKDFEDDFPYSETPDQKSSFDDIRKDISLIKPMNRILCGDVGFGKTEVAMKAAFIAANSNKQTILITPSTILTDQHFDTFLERFRNFGIKISKLNRFISKDNKTKVINDFGNHKIDILITTHIVFNNDINFKNTGLLIIDEEHKFGIKQKNFIKNKQENIHILYLSATPIPRTMNMVFSGLKDFSFLQTAPVNRINIKSFLKVQNNKLLKEALIRERSRNGQSFIVQNDISKILNIKKLIVELIPDYKIGVAHGQLNKKDIKRVMSQFKNGSLDGLICTTIVEMGLDIPNANTMIIINSHNFGLSQLHQLRGRIGRSNKQGYCYFLIPDIEIPKISKARLDSIVRNSKLGEGFKIAQEDLDIRGAGEMLGEKQSGHINNVGISLYLSMLKKAIDSADKKNITTSIRPDVNFNDSSYIDSCYLPSPIERLKVYRNIQNVSSIKDIEEIRKNLIDRCGAMPIEASNLLDNKKISIRIYESGIEYIKSNNINTNIKLSKSINDDVLNKILHLISINNDLYSITKDNKFIYKNSEKDSALRRKNVNLLLDEIL